MCESKFIRVKIENSHAVFLNIFLILLITATQNDDWFVAPGYNSSGKATSVIQCGPKKPDTVRNCDIRHCLFNLQQDPCEYNDLSAQYPRVVRKLKRRIERYRRGMVKQRNRRREEEADPDLHGSVWGPWR